MRSIREAIVVEGRYDKAKLASLIDATIVVTNGFSVYKDKEKCGYLRRLAAERGLIILTDSDNAGRQIRGFLTSFIPAAQIRHAYIPDVYGKESRKPSPSKEGKLGVEGVPAEVLLAALDAAGAKPLAGEIQPLLSPADFVLLGLTGGENSRARRKAVLKTLSLPENLTNKMLLRWVDTDEKLQSLLSALKNFEADT